MELRQVLQLLKEGLAPAKQESRAASVQLANARFQTISPFAANPFFTNDESTAQEASLMTAAIEKEKSKMGETGNKRKVVTPVTMLDRSDTFFTPEVERLIEGLPGSKRKAAGDAGTKGSSSPRPASYDVARSSGSTPPEAWMIAFGSANPRPGSPQRLSGASRVNLGAIGCCPAACWLCLG